MITNHASIHNRFVDWVMLRLSENTSVDGLWIGVFSEELGKEILNRLCEALRMIKTFDPSRYRRVLRETRRIWAFLLPASDAVWLRDFKRCVVDPRFIMAVRPEFIASAIVHEATHGRLMRSGIGYPEELRHRVEKICVRQELAFASKIPGGDELRKAIKDRLASDLFAPKHWTDDEFKRRDAAGEAEMVRYTGIPDWLFKLTVWIRERKTRRQ